MTEATQAHPSGRRFAFGSAVALLIYCTGIGLAFLSQLLFARILGPASYGAYTYVIAWVSVLAFCANLGFKVSILRFVSVYESQKAWGLLRGVVRYAERRIGVASLLILVIGAGIVMLRKETLDPEVRQTFLVSFLLVPIWAFLWLRSAVARAHGAVAFALMPERVVRDGVLLAAVIVAYFGFGLTFDATKVMGVMVVSSLLGLMMASTAAARLRPKAIDRADFEYDAGTWRRTALPLLLVGAFEVLFNRTGVMALGWFAPIEDVGIYGLAFNFGLLALLPRTAIDTLVAPAISRLHSQGKGDKLQRLLTQAGAGSLFAAACICAFLWLTAEHVMGWFGRDYQAGAGTLMILLAGQLLYASFGSQFNVLNMTGNEWTCATILGAGSALNIALTALLVHHYGMIGAAWGAVISQAVLSCALAIFVYRRLNLLPGVYGLLRYFR